MIKWLLGHLLWLPKLGVIGTLIYLGYDYFNGLTGFSGIDVAMLGGMLVAALVIIENQQEKLLKRRTRLRLPKRSKKAPVAPPPEAPTAPVKPVERRFAPVPVAEAVEHQLHAPRSAMPDHLRRFVEDGDRAIHRPPAPASSSSAAVMPADGPTSEPADLGRPRPPGFGAPSQPRPSRPPDQ